MAIFATSTFAQTYPAKPVRVIIPFPAGGGADIFARLMGRKLQDVLGQPFVADNRAGASGIIGCELVARAPADGYTLLMGPRVRTARTPRSIRSCHMIRSRISNPSRWWPSRRLRCSFIHRYP